jgi:hypothetical protein
MFEHYYSFKKTLGLQFTLSLTWHFIFLCVFWSQKIMKFFHEKFAIQLQCQIPIFLEQSIPKLTDLKPKSTYDMFDSFDWRGISSASLSIRLSRGWAFQNGNIYLTARQVYKPKALSVQHVHPFTKGFFTSWHVIFRVLQEAMVEAPNGSH